MGECQNVAIFHVFCNLVFVDFRCQFVRYQHHNYIACFCSFFDFHNFQTSCFCFCCMSGAFSQTNNNIHTAFFQVLCMGMALAAKTDDSNCLAVQHRQITILIIVLFNHSYRLLFFRVFPVFSFVTFLFCKAPFDACDACTANFNDIIAGYHIHKAVQFLRRACQFNNHTVFGKVDDLSSIYIHDFA